MLGRLQSNEIRNKEDYRSIVQCLEQNTVLLIMAIIRQNGIE